MLPGAAKIVSNKSNKFASTTTFVYTTGSLGWPTSINKPFVHWYFVRLAKLFFPAQNKRVSGRLSDTDRARIRETINQNNPYGGSIFSRIQPISWLLSDADRRCDRGSERSGINIHARQAEVHMCKSTSRIAGRIRLEDFTSSSLLRLYTRGLRGWIYTLSSHLVDTRYSLASLSSPLSCLLHTMHEIVVLLSC